MQMEKQSPKSKILFDLKQNCPLSKILIEMSARHHTINLFYRLNVSIFIFLCEIALLVFKFRLETIQLW